MNQEKKMAKNIAKSLVFAIGEYRHYNRGRYPEKIFAELGALYALRLECPTIFDPDRELKFNGIPIVPIGRDGTGMWLTGCEVSITDFKDPGAELIIHKGELNYEKNPNPVY